MVTQQERLKAASIMHDQICELQDAKHKMLMDWAKEECPFSIGDTVECAGFSHRGKPMIVKGITYRHIFDVFKWKVRGVVLKKDGTEGKQRADFTQIDYEARCAQKKNRRSI